MHGFGFQRDSNENWRYLSCPDFEVWVHKNL